MGSTKIEWADAVWNPVTGCTKVSLHPDRLEQPLCWRKPRRIFVCSTCLRAPLVCVRTRAGRHRQMGDLLHPDVPDEFVVKVVLVMAMTPHHTYLVLSKRVRRMVELCRAAPWFGKAIRAEQLPGLFPNTPGLNVGVSTFACSHRILPNVWWGTSIEDQATAHERIPELSKCPAAVRFLSCEPLLGPIDASGAD